MEILDSFSYIGRNRRSEKTASEQLLELTKRDQEALAQCPEITRGKMLEQLSACGVGKTDLALLRGTLPEQTLGLFSFLFAGGSLAMQRATGHDVGFYQSIPGRTPDRVIVVIEFEVSEVGSHANQLALELLAEIVPGLSLDGLEPLAGGSFEQKFRDFQAFSRPLALPADTQYLIDAAARLDVPVIKLEREPYQGIEGDFRIRPNGLLLMGQACYQHVVDGTFCIDRHEHLRPLLRDRRQITEALRRLEVPVPRHVGIFNGEVLPTRAMRRARQAGYPLVVKPVEKNRGELLFRNIEDDLSLRSAIERIQESGSEVMVEAHVPGRLWYLLMASHQLTAVLNLEQSIEYKGEIHPSTRDMAESISRRMDTGLMALTIAATDISLPLDQTGGAVVDLDLVPELDGVVGLKPVHIEHAMEGFVRWLYPEGTPSRIPLVAVTGTNGKTTTSTMIMRICQHAGYITGMAGTTGIFMNGKRVEIGDRAGTGGHLRIQESRELNFGVLETARGGITHTGFQFDHCNIAACLGVEDDHIGELGIMTLEEMAEVKLSVLKRATDAVVLNADNEMTLKMNTSLPGRRLALVTLGSDLDRLRELAGPDGLICALENRQGEEWLVLEEDGVRKPVMPVNEIPATYEGLARFNVSNALHAMAVCYLSGVDSTTIRGGLAAFDSSFENNPGRLNFYLELPFTVLLDYFHNTDGLNKLSPFLQKLEVRGRRILMIGKNGKRTNESIRNFTRSIRDHFDMFLFRDLADLAGREPNEVPRIMRDTLLADGLPEGVVEILYDRDTAVTEALKRCRPGDLLVVSPGTRDIEMAWEQITSFPKQPG